MGRRAATWAVSVVVLLTIAAAGYLLVRSTFNQPKIDPQVFQAVERDPGFSATPPNAERTTFGRRLDCRDDSGDPPQTFRGFSVALADEQVVQFYRQELAMHGWTSNGSGSGGQEFSKTVEGHLIELLVYASPEDDTVSIAARTSC